MNNKKVTLKILENVTDEEIKNLFEGLKKIEGFEFGIGAYIKTCQSQNDESTV